MENFLDFTRDLPQPFTGISRRVKGVTSTYSGSATFSTLSTTVIKAVNTYISIDNGSSRGGVGTGTGTFICEYKSSVDEEWHLVEFDSNKKSVRASVYDALSDTCTKYTVNAKNRDGAAIVLCMMPMLLQNKEFEDAYNEYKQYFDLGFPDVDLAKNSAALLCDNVYRRIKDDSLSCAVKHNIDKSGNVFGLNMAEIQSGALAPQSLITGEFVILSTVGGTVPSKAGVKKALAIADFEGKYPLMKSSQLTPVETKKVPKLGDWFVIPDEAVKICQTVQKTSGNNIPMRNFLLRGPAGTGKTSIAKAVAAGLGLPYAYFTCSADTEVYDFVGQIIPDMATGGSADGDIAELEKLGGITNENVAKILGLPDMDDIEFEPEESYEKLTGVKKSGATMQDCMKEYNRIVSDKMNEVLKAKYTAETGTTTARYTYQYTDFLQALQNGWVIEIQEPTVIVRPGVLVGLNGLLEQGGVIRLPDGSTVKRHPDAVVIVTTNVSYEGCRGLNQSVIDRMNLVLDVDMPDDTTLAERVMNLTGETDSNLVDKMIRVMHNIEDFCQKSAITDGVTGPRTLFDWVQLNTVLNNEYDSALSTIIAKATADPEDRASIVSTCLAPIFGK